MIAGVEFSPWVLNGNNIKIIRHLFRASEMDFVNHDQEGHEKHTG